MAENWRNLPELPSSSEVMPEERDPLFPDNGDTEDRKALPHNIVRGPWASTEAYVAAHYLILREDAVDSLRSAVRAFRTNPGMRDDKKMHIYTYVHFKGMNLGNMGPAFRVEFSTERAGCRVNWMSSKRLIQGTVVALSPDTDMFSTICKIGVVAARPMKGGLDQNPPNVDIFWGDCEDTIIDPDQSYVMIEARTGYFEAYRHTLKALQCLRSEQFPLANHLAALDKSIGAPDYLEENQFLDLSSLAAEDCDDAAPLFNAKVLDEFPAIPTSELDASQMEACKRILTKKVAIVQGPPGTGKTFTSKSALKVMVNNTEPGDPPIIVCAQTNHALDQLLHHVLDFTKDILRLGNRYNRADTSIGDRTLYALRMENKKFTAGASGLRLCKKQLQQKIEEIKSLLEHLVASPEKGGLLTDYTLQKHELITEKQQASLYNTKWARTTNARENGQFSGLLEWLGQENVVNIRQTPRVDPTLPEEDDDDVAISNELEEETQAFANDEYDVEGLSGVWLPFTRQYTGRPVSSLGAIKIKKYLDNHSNLMDVPEGHRGAFYRYWEKKLDNLILKKLKVKLREFENCVNKHRDAKRFCSFKLIENLGIKIVGCTTTGLSKYRSLLAELKPRILLVEEAAETIEGNIIAGMIASLQQLILVGDHQQLRAQCNIEALALEPYNLNVSMFERLVTNGIEFTMLNTQRRMVPNVRGLLCIEPKQDHQQHHPFYRNLNDHPTVLDRINHRPFVPGMGELDTFFYHHQSTEGKNDNMSKLNEGEAEMIVGVFSHLVLNGTDPKKITVLTFYNGQRKKILQKLRLSKALGHVSNLGVYTVDKFQGEENDIVLLSLVRSNWYNEVGFLDNKNRLVVALSRARRGLYIFGNAHTLTGGETHGQRQGRDELWGPLIRQMSSQGRLATSFPITCSKHSNVVHIAEAKNWDGLNGGCREKCDGVLECGHDCIYYCHPYDHRLMVCQADCSKKLRCGHMCSEVCGDQCRCARCSVQTRPAPVKVRAAVQTRPAPVQVRAVVHADRSTNPGSGVHGSSGPALLDLEDNHRNHGSEAGHQPNVEDRAKALLRWNAFDAEKDDAERHEKAMIARANLPQNETTVIRDTWKPISVVDGARIVHRAETTTIPQYNVKSPTNPKGNTTEQSLIDVSDDLTQLDLSNANRPHNEIHSFSDLCELMTPSEQEIDLYGASPPRPPPRVLHGPQNAGTGAGPVAPQMSLLDTDPEELSFELLQPEKKIQ